MSLKRKIGIALAVGCAYIVVKGMINAPDTRATSTQSVEVDPVKQAVMAGMEKRQIEAERVAALESFTASEIAKAYSQNTYAADQTFKGRDFKVTGTVASINTDFRGKPYVTMKGGANRFQEPQFAIAESDEKFAVSLKPGDEITLACTGRGDVAKTPMSGQCTFIW
ncbi:hypothetical protein C206_08739 [Pseudomonas putida TRO1]|uniref:Ig-like domain-containing protein n=3 Tax=Pseudomonas TaxID=286 RepID=A0AAP7KEW3_9PSED|nr:hypothetical protein C206_08739 [Pseudomonas putida TRO1]OAH47903.1 hypothetical protein AYJ70_05830 [Pseudomonas monteilii]PKF25560.1 hypothetical protein CW309_16445 [Pseudomonas hunanensis]